jgi:hypothetical protein
MTEPLSDQLELFDPDDDGLDFGEWMATLPLIPKRSLDKDLGRGTAYWARQKRLREAEGWIRDD